MTDLVVEAVVSDGGESMPYAVRSRLESLALMIEHADKRRENQSVAGVKAILAGVDDKVGLAAARSLAAMLGMPLQRVDISQFYARYIGNAENHLEQMLDKAQASHALVLFDRLDDLFGHGSLSSSAHDRHVQLDVGYFLNTLAGYPVPAILRTSAYHRLDLAIVRQFACVVDLDDGVLPRQRRATA